jgi:hypothetical protein
LKIAGNEKSDKSADVEELSKMDGRETSKNAMKMYKIKDDMCM